MSVSALSNAGSAQLLQAGNLSGFQQAAQTLGKSLTAGNLPAAKTAFKKLQQLNVNRSTLGSADPRLTADLTTLGTALKAGKIDAAKTAFSTVQKDLAGTNAAAITTAANAAKQIAGQIDAVLNLNGNNSSISSLFSPGSGGTDIAGRTTAYLNLAYGNTAAPSPNVTGTTLSVSA